MHTYGKSERLHKGLTASFLCIGEQVMFIFFALTRRSVAGEG
jgi:hypothetical protein